MKTWIMVFLFNLALVAMLALPVTAEQSETAARVLLARHNVDSGLYCERALQLEGKELARVYTLDSGGYVVVCADDELPPVLAYSFTSSFAGQDADLLAELITEDICQRLYHLPVDIRVQNRVAWQNLSAPRDPFQQWPPEGSTVTGGWIKTQWTQSAPYNDFCPIDPVTQVRSQAGCPAVAMAQIVNYYQTINGTVFDDSDDYHHNYSGRNFWIDDDYAQHGFPSWPWLNTYLAATMQHYKYNQDQTDSDKAALTWACGAAAQQVYTSSGSGTFSVAQAFAAYQRFGFQGMELLTDTAPDLYNRMAQNMMDARPVHLAVVTPAWDSGHNVVVDGYNTDNFFHLNFGWGGSYSGWYLLPAQIPFNLTVIEGAIVDIQPRQYLFSTPDTLFFLTQESVYQDQTLELINISDAPLTIEAINAYPQYLGVALLILSTEGWVFPVIIPSVQSLILTLQWIWPVDMPRTLINGRIEVTHANGVFSVPMVIENSWFYSDAEDEVQPPGLISVYPNPFGQELHLKSNAPGEITAAVYNLKGQRVATLQGSKDLVWNACDVRGNPVAAGVYLLKVEQSGRMNWRRVLKLH